MTLESIIKLWESASAATADAKAWPATESRYRGVLLGAAVGNLLGIPVEGMDKRSLRRSYPSGIKDIDPEEKHRPWDDDLAQTVILTEAILAGETLDFDDLAQRLVKWAEESGRGIGNLTVRVLREISHGTPASYAAKKVWEADGRQPAGNGAVMRCSPVALKWRNNPEKLVDESLGSAVVTHFDPRCQWSVVAINIALALCLDEETVELATLTEALETAGAPSAVGEAIRSVAGYSIDDLALDDPRAMGYTLKAMQAGLWASVQTESFEDALIAIVNEGGDTDTNGAVAGAMLGGRYGAGDIPERWLKCIPDRERLEGLALQLLIRSEFPQ